MTDFKILQNTYNKSDNVLFLITPLEGDVFTQKALDSVTWLTRQAWQMTYSTRVDSITNFQHSYANEDDLIVADLVENAVNLKVADLNRIKLIP